MKLFEGLNSEKQSPIFLSLAKSKNSGKLSRIKNNMGQEFASDDERVEYITGFYEQLYKKNLGEPESFENIIENFLALTSLTPTLYAIPN